MDDAPNAAQAEFWNDGGGAVWAAFQVDLDRQVAPLGRVAMRALDPREGEHVLDIGCGCGESTWELAAKVGHAGAVVGVDLSRPMLAVARARDVEADAPRPTFREVDAQTGDLGDGAFDGAFSRFGVMFFADPPAAFANIRRSLRPGGRLAFVCWRAMAENPMMYAPAEAAAALLPPAERPDPNAPGPFAFADPARVRAILAEAGFSDVGVEPFDTHVGGADLDVAVRLALRLGPLGRALRDQPSLFDAVTPLVRARLSDYLTAEGVKFPAAVWIVTARA